MFGPCLLPFDLCVFGSGLPGLFKLFVFINMKWEWYHTFIKRKIEVDEHCKLQIYMK